MLKGLSTYMNISHSVIVQFNLYVNTNRKMLKTHTSLHPKKRKKNVFLVFFDKYLQTSEETNKEMQFHALSS